MSDDIASKADAFMQRPRPVVAGTDDADLPVLTEIVPAPLAGAATTGPPDVVIQALDAWLEQEVPLVVARVLDGVVDRIAEELAARARTQLLPRLLQAAEPPAKPE